MISLETIENTLCEFCGSEAKLRLSYVDGGITNCCIQCSPITCLTIPGLARKLHITDRQAQKLCEQGEYIAKQSPEGDWVILDVEERLSTIHHLKELVGQGFIRYDRNLHVSNYIDAFDYMKIRCDGQNLIYSIHGNVPLDKFQIILPLSLIKSIQDVYLPNAELVQDPLYIEIDDEFIVYLYFVTELYEKGKLIGTEIPNENTIQIHSLKRSDMLFPLTHPQQRIWAIERIYNEEDSAMHNIGGLVLISGAVEFGILEKAFQQFIAFHDGIRICFNEQGMQYVSEYKKIPLQILEYSHIPYDEALESLKNKFQSYMPLIHSPLYEIILVKFNEQKSGYFLKFHHAIADGWSVQLFTDQIHDLYLALKNKENYEIKGRSYLDFITIEQQYFNSKRLHQDKQFWLNKFADLPDRLMHPHQLHFDAKGKREVFTVEDNTYLQLQNLIQDNKMKVSMNSFFITLFILHEWLTNNETDIIIGTPVLNRSGIKEKSMFGMFTSTMPFRYLFNEERTFSNMLLDVNTNLLQCYFHQRYPYELLIRELKTSQNLHGDLFSTSVNYYNTKLVSNIEGHLVENIEFYSGHQLFPLNVIVKEWSGLQLFFDYRLDTYTHQQVRNFYHRISNIMDACLRSPHMNVRELRDQMERN